ncbi:WYL domain-containing protein [Colwellia sp. MB02u-18]|uniref:helix-turn-helix transcriptional regulator n=1 Tax=unclassified Colwellia TaxID=196834 RepID=UPI0015F3D934|nr:MULTISPECIES: WYL domain-containing protein [unclassified Colwellia]MBA6224219.1 WYL domain-containing protein [Colwellia sp. MB3u-45]MBA6268349.1 WYL domain-containing protein [Colwellia sp. MB3u-43]MBA6322699.1 WYL domain-containing protein [Colwellia sp. MB02u-19]MBA6323551.1 WYL domain-containing protein [Colwellia sp. MB02u-18]MBA6332842.1 WYL domain-containing protein [Colwellia sp. MB02u-12]
MSNSTTLRHLEMLRKIPLAPGKPITTIALHQHLTDEGFDVSKRTVERDLVKLTNIGGLYSENTAEGYGWGCIQNNASKFKGIQPTEALMLILSEKLLLKVMPIEYTLRAEARIADAKCTLNSDNAFSKWQEKLQVISEGYPLINNNSLISEDARKIIYDCVLKANQINITYQAKDKNASINYCLNPLGIIIRGQSHYLVATKKDSPEKPKLFLFHRIKIAEKNHTKMDAPRSFTVQEYFAKNPSGWLLKAGNKIEIVELKVKGFALDTLTNNQLADDQQLLQTSTQWTHVQFSCIPTYDLVAWILKYGADVTCESPTYLKVEVVRALKNSLNNYEY